jgi:hypothetical protein
LEFVFWNKIARLRSADAASSRKHPSSALLRRFRKTFPLFNAGYTLIWQGDDALLAGPQYKASHWESPSGIHLACSGEPVPQGITRQASSTSLPWSITATVDSRPLPEFSARRIVLLAALLALLILICAVACFAWRAISRELGIARLHSDFVASVSHEFPVRTRDHR